MAEATRTPYDHAAQEERWQRFWLDERLFACDTQEEGKRDYVLMMFPYPSGHLHVGHGRNYILGDALVRYRIMAGHAVLSPMGWDAFGLPAENAAIRTGTPPAESTRANIAALKEQLARWGCGYDWEREIASCDPDYYRWTQWLFLELLDAGLAEQKTAALNWCPSCATVLANEQAQEGKCERCGSEVEARDMEQWFFRITDYAQRLLDDLGLLERWPDHVRAMQRNWIGRSEGVEVDFELLGSGGEPVGRAIRCFTTRPDTLPGATFLALSPEHAAAGAAASIGAREAEVAVFCEEARKIGGVRREQEDRPKKGIDTGALARNPLTGEAVPVWVADYVLSTYGTGAIMCVPAHDERDRDFASQEGLDVVVTSDSEGIQVNSGEFDGQPSTEVWEAVADRLEAEGTGQRQTTWRLRDWCVSRQRYWGAPIPVVHCPDCGVVGVPAEDLPVLLPDNVEFTAEGESPLARCEEWVVAACPSCGRADARRETDTMDTFVDSSWYFLRFVDPKNTDAPFDREEVDRWMPVEQYIGGVEHAVLHLLYARFVTKVLQDRGHIGFPEPFGALFTQGMICRTSHRCAEHGYVAIADGAEAVCPECGGALRSKLDKMSKSKMNAVNPDSLLERYGVDTQRLYTLFIGPPDKDAEWNDRAAVGQHRFIEKIWGLVTDAAGAVRAAGGPAAVSGEGGDARLRRASHGALLKMTAALGEDFEIHTAISKVHEMVGAWEKTDAADPAVAEASVLAVRMLAPLTPHLSEECWAGMGGEGSVFRAGWPAADPALVAADTLDVAVQVQGKVRARIEVAADAAEDAIREEAEAAVTEHLDGREVVKAVVVLRATKGTGLVNLVVR